MDELEPKRHPIDMESEVGMSRRDLLRRSAVVGGALLWAAPAIQTVGMKAAAAYGPSPGLCAACYCYDLDQNGIVTANEGNFNGVVGNRFTADDCENWCKWQAQFATNGAAGGPYQKHYYCSGATQNGCRTTPSVGLTEAQALAGVTCT